MGEMYAAALIGVDADAFEMASRSLAGSSVKFIVYCYRVRSLRAARKIADLIIAPNEKHVFGSCPSAEFFQVGDLNFSPSAVRVPLTATLLIVALTALLPLRPPLATPVLALLLSLLPGERPDFSRSSLLAITKSSLFLSPIS